MSFRLLPRHAAGALVRTLHPARQIGLAKYYSSESPKSNSTSLDEDWFSSNTALASSSAESKASSNPATRTGSTSKQEPTDSGPPTSEFCTVGRLPARPASHTAPALSLDQLTKHYNNLSSYGWSIVLNVFKRRASPTPQDFSVYELRRTFKFKTFKAAMVFVNEVADFAKKEKHHPIISVDYNLVHIHVHTHKSLRPRGPDLFQLEELPAKDFKEGAEIGPSLTDLDVRFAMLCESLYIEKDDVDISGDAPTEAEQMGVYFAPGNNRQRKPATERCQVCGLRHFSSPCGRPKSEQEKVAKRDKVEEVAQAQDGTEATEHSQTSKTCQYCGGSHTTANCQLLPQMRAIHERHLARQANGQASEVQTGTSSSATSSSLSCTICLRKGHGPWDCPERFTKPARTPCPVCGRRHWKVNCPETSDNKRRLRRIQDRHAKQAQVGIPEGSQLSVMPSESSRQDLDVTVERGDSPSQPRRHDDPGDIRRLSKLSEGISIEYHT